jgi:hypothetical protein
LLREIEADLGGHLEVVRRLQGIGIVLDGAQRVGGGSSV